VGILEKCKGAEKRCHHGKNNGIDVHPRFYLVDKKVYFGAAEEENERPLERVVDILKGLGLKNLKV